MGGLWALELYLRFFGYLENCGRHKLGNCARHGLVIIHLNGVGLPAV